MRTLYSIIFFLLLFHTNNFSAQTAVFKTIEKQVIDNNKEGKQQASIKLLLEYINEATTSNYDKYQYYLLKSYIHKSLFDYDNTFKALKLAEEVGLKSDKAEEIKANVMAEKAFAYFDIQKYDVANQLMKQLRVTNYQYIQGATTAMLVMQEGYLDYKNKNFVDAESKLNDAISLMQKFNSKNLPIVYGKKMELYKELKQHTKAMEAFKLGLQSAQKTNTIKYQIYMYEQLREQQMFDNDWKAAFKSFQIIDDLETKYNVEDTKNKMQLSEKDIEIQKKDFELSKGKILRNSLLILSLLLFLGLYLFIKLYKSNKQKRVLIEKEYQRIHDELEILTKKLDNQGITKIDFKLFNLTDRQIEIIELIRIGKSNKEIGNFLFISENTVKYHLKTIYDILNIENRREFYKLINE